MVAAALVGDDCIVTKIPGHRKNNLPSEKHMVKHSDYQYTQKKWF